MSEIVPWGESTAIDLYGCNPATIRSAYKLRQFAKELVELIDMKAFGPCMIENFGAEERVAGYTMVQMIETSIVAGHFANASNAAYLDVFSCKPYDEKKAAAFAKKFFEAKEVIVQKLMRR